MEMFIYQNRTTGEPSKSPLSIAQLCRILCPKINKTTTRSDAKNGTTIQNQASNTCLIQPGTLLLGFDPESGQYSKEGWVEAKTNDILREACASWHYEGEGRQVMGPVSARSLAELFHPKNGNNDQKNENKVDENTRVWSSDISNENGGSSEWKRIGDLPNLQTVLNLFVSQRPSEVPLSSQSTENISNYSQLQSVNEKNDDIENQMDAEAAKELEAFLTSNANHLSNIDDDENEEGFESDGGTYYIKNSNTGEWTASKKRHLSSTIATKITNRQIQNNSTKNNTNNNEQLKKKRKKKTQFAAKNAKTWVYVTGLPKDTNEDEVAKYFSKAGILQLDPETQRPKVKLYRHKNNSLPSNRNKNTMETLSNIVPGTLKGDASICYARSESVELALQILDDSIFRLDSKNPLSVKRAKFEQHGDTFQDTGRNKSLSMAKRKVARLAALQAVGWDEGNNGRITGGLKGLRIIVLKGMFTLHRPDSDSDIDKSLPDNEFMKLEQEIRSRCVEFGNVEKITIFSKNKDGVVIVKFTQPTAASEALKALDGTLWGTQTRKVIATYWDGVTDYTIREEEKEIKEQEHRHEEFGRWLDNQDLPEEFRLRVEGS